MNDNTLNHPGPRLMPEGGPGDLVGDMKMLLAYLISDQRKLPMLDSALLQRAYRSVSEFPDNDPNEATDQEWFELREHACLLLCHLDSHREVLQGLDRKLVEDVQRHFASEPGIPPEPVMPSGARQSVLAGTATPERCAARPRGLDHVFANSLKGRVCMWCGTPDPSVKQPELHLTANEYKPRYAKEATTKAEQSDLIKSLEAQGYTKPIARGDQPRTEEVIEGIERSKLTGPGARDLYAQAARSILGTTDPSPVVDEYVRITLPISAREWLRGRMSALRLDVLIERKRILRDRGANTKLHADLLRTLERDLVEIAKVSDALL